MGMTGIILDNAVINMCIATGSSAVMGAVFLYTGITVAPSHRRNLARILGGMVLLIAVLAGYSALYRGRYGNLVDVLSMLAGAAAVLLCSRKGWNKGSGELQT